MLRLATPWALALLPLVLLLLWDAARRAGRKRASVGYSDLDLLEAAHIARPSWESHLPLGLVSLAVALLTLGLARPQSSLGMKPVTSEGLDIILCLDTSPSMQAPDVAPTRMDAARAVSLAFVQGRPDDRIGVVVFSGISLTQCPLTVDHPVLLQLLEGVRVGMTQTDGTAVGDGLLTSVNRLKDVPGNSKVVILLTDGRSNAGEIDPLTAAKMATRFGIKVYTIGVGTQEGGSFTRTDEFGFPQAVPIEADLDEGTLREIASLTGGKYFRATDAESLASVYAEIDRLEKRVAPRQVVVDYRELYPWFVAPGLLLLALALVLEHTLLMEVP